VTTLNTARLDLMPFAPYHLLALIDSPERFEEQFGYAAADGLRDFLVSDEVSPMWLERLRREVDADPWVQGFGVVHRQIRNVIGTASFKGPPDGDGVVEIAYGIVPTLEGNGYATEAAAALVAFASADERVRLIRAHTLPKSGASPAVLMKCGFAHLGEVEDAEDGIVWRWEREPAPPGGVR
jgi:RimJ/RimL family protein N-acetyltransferase